MSNSVNATRSMCEVALFAMHDTAVVLACTAERQDPLTKAHACVEHVLVVVIGHAIQECAPALLDTHDKRWCVEDDDFFFGALAGHQQGTAQGPGSFKACRSIARRRVLRPDRAGTDPALHLPAYCSTREELRAATGPQQVVVKKFEADPDPLRTGHFQLITRSLSA
ncbi:MAG: hypothetical protein IT229_03260 [Flavobacteriales bacterium]|nr:hypothetical protein [Flavobacteriales bacterium]